MTIISDLKRKINLYFFDSEDVDGDAYLFYGVIGLMLVMAIIYTTLNII